MAQRLSNLPIGTRIKFGKHSVNGETAQDIIWLVVAKNHSGYPSNSVTLLTEQLIDIRAADATEPDNTNSARVACGNNNYALSNIHQWLNKAESTWFVKSHDADNAPSDAYVSNKTGYYYRPGFLYNFSVVERSAILHTTIRSILPTVDNKGLFEDIQAYVTSEFNASFIFPLIMR